MKLFDFLNFNSKKHQIGISVAQNGLMELIEVDPKTLEVIKYSNLKIEYNISSREISDYITFQETLKNLFTENNLIPTECDVVLSLPNVFFSFIKVPSGLSETEQKVAITSEAEQNYFLRKYSPRIDFKPINSNSTDNIVVAAALQENIILQIKDIFEELKCTLKAIETSSTSLIRGILSSGILGNEVRANKNINIVLISASSYSIFSLEGDKWLEIFEIPMPIQSLDETEIYQSIISSVMETLESFSTDCLMVVSETDSVSAEIFANKLQVSYSLYFIEKNKYANTKFTKVSHNVLPEYANSISLDAYGVGVYDFCNYSFKINLLSAEESDAPSIGFMLWGQQILIPTYLIQRLILLIMFLEFVLFAGAYSLFAKLNENMRNEINTLSTNITQTNNELSSITGRGPIFDLAKAQINIINVNKKEILYYDAISIDVPNGLWLTNFYTDSTGGVLIRGESTSVENIYSFFKSIKNMITNSDITLTTLEFKNKDNIDNLYNSSGQIYIFELSNSAFTKSKEILSKEKINANKNVTGIEPTEGTPSVDTVLLETVQQKTDQKKEESAPKDLPKV